MKKSKIQFGIIGNPVHHSLSPAMQNAAFKKFKLPYQYKKIKLNETQLKSFFDQLRQSDKAGINITVPHKENVIPFLDELSPEAKLIGAVNTLQLHHGKLIGYNTDGAGYVQSLLKEKKWSPKNKRITLLGAGGAARGIIVALALAGAKEIYISNRTKEKAKKLAQEFQKKLKKTRFDFSSLQAESLRKIFKNTDLLINTTPGGMQGNEILPLPLDQLPQKALVSDIVYKPSQTSLLKAAKKLGLKTQGGLGMLLYQGALAFEIWTGRKAPITLMKKALMKNLA